MTSSPPRSAAATRRSPRSLRRGPPATRPRGRATRRSPGTWTASRRWSPGTGSTPLRRPGAARPPTGCRTPPRPGPASRCASWPSGPRPWTPTATAGHWTASARRRRPPGTACCPRIPWQLRLLDGQPWLRRALRDRVLVDLGEGPRAVVPDVLGPHRLRPGGRRLLQVQPQRADHQLRQEELLVRAGRRGGAHRADRPGPRRPGRALSRYRRAGRTRLPDGDAARRRGGRGAGGDRPRRAGGAPGPGRDAAARRRAHRAACRSVGRTRARRPARRA